MAALALLWTSVQAKKKPSPPVQGVGSIPEPFKETVRRVIEVARTYQEPYDLMHYWGDPTTIKGAMEPTMEYGWNVNGYSLTVEFTYDPPVKAPRRLRVVTVQYHAWKDKKPFSRQALKDWLGEPVEVMHNERFKDGREEWMYYCTDKAGLGLNGIARYDGGTLGPVIELAARGNRP